MVLFWFGDSLVIFSFLPFFSFVRSFDPYIHGMAERQHSRSERMHWLWLCDGKFIRNYLNYFNYLILTRSRHLALYLLCITDFPIGVHDSVSPCCISVWFVWSFALPISSCTLIMQLFWHRILKSMSPATRSLSAESPRHTHSPFMALLSHSTSDFTFCVEVSPLLPFFSLFKIIIY